VISGELLIRIDDPAQSFGRLLKLREWNRDQHLFRFQFGVGARAYAAEAQGCAVDGDGSLRSTPSGGSLQKAIATGASSSFKASFHACEISVSDMIILFS
jgi:hypothetical protein